MKKICENVWDLISKKILAITLVWLFIVLALMFYFINKSFYFSDEAYYWFSLIPDLEQIELSNWHRIYGLINLENIVYDKILLSAIKLLSVTLFAVVSVKLFFKTKYHLVFTLVTIGSLFLLLGPNLATVPYYGSLNNILLLFSTAFLFLFFLYNYTWSLYVSGLFIGVLPFVMITNVPVVLLFLGLIWFYKREFKFLIVFLFGVLSFIGFYFAVIQSPQLFLFKLKEAASYIEDDSTHGVLEILKWVLNIFMDKIALGLLFLIYYNINKKYSFNKWLNLFVVLLFFYWCGLIFLDTVTRKPNIINTRLYYFLAIAILWDVRRIIKFKLFLLVVFLLLLPFFASVGTDVSFYVRSAAYFPFIIMSLILLLTISKKKVFIATFFIITLVSSVFYLAVPYRGTWGGFRGIEQNQKFDFSKGTIYLDENRYNNLEELKPYIENKDNVIVSSPILLGYIYLNDAKPPFVFHKVNKATEKFLIHGQYDYKSYIFVEGKDSPFEMDFLNNVTHGNFSRFIKKETQNFNIYHYNL